MDPCPFIRILIGNLALKFPVSTKPSLSRIHPATSPCYCKIKFQNFPAQQSTIPLVSQDFQDPESTSLSQSLGACFNLNKSQVDRILQKQNKNKKMQPPSLKIEVYTGRGDTSCWSTSNGKLLGSVHVKLDLRSAQNRASMVYGGWIPIGEKKKGSFAELFVSVKAEPDPRFVFKFGGEPENSPQVFQVQGSTKQAVFTCNFSCRNSADRNLGSRPSMSESNPSWNWLQSLGGDKDQTSKERKGWSITVHDLSGSPVAMASMVTPFVPSPGTDRVSRSNPGAWLILRPGQGTWKPWGRLEAWRERCGGSDSVGYRFQLINDTIGATNTTIVDSSVSTKTGGKFTIDTTNSVTSSTPLTSPHSSCDFGSWSDTHSGSRPNSRPGSGSGSDFGFHCPSYRGFVMASTVEGVGKCSKPEVEVGVHHVSCTEDAAAFVALAAAMDLSMDACMLFNHKLRKELRQQRSQNFVV